MRESVFREPKIGEFDQGAIFGSCIADEYSDCDVYGIIITPKCDIANEKVTTFHYLPIITYKEWLRVNFWEILKKTIHKQLDNSLGGMLKNKGLSKEIIGKENYSNILYFFEEKFTKSKEKEKFKLLVSHLVKLEKTKDVNPSEEEFLFFYTTFQKTTDSLLKEITENKRNDFYLMEDWNDDQPNNYVIILSREVRRIRYDAGLRIAKGLEIDTFKEIDFQRNDLQSRGKSEIIYVEAMLNSPFLEHLIQHFNQNFARIGILDHPRETLANLSNNI